MANSTKVDDSTTIANSLSIMEVTQSISSEYAVKSDSPDFKHQMDPKGNVLHNMTDLRVNVAGQISQPDQI